MVTCQPAPPPLPAKASPAQRSTEVVVVNRTDELASYAAELDALARAALEPNPFYEPWLLLPAARHFGNDCALEFVLVFARDSAGQGAPRQLIGFFPIERQRTYKGFPLGVIKLWKHIHCFYCAPLVRSDTDDTCLRAFLRWFAEDSAASLLELSSVPGEGPFAQALLRALGELDLPAQRTGSITRAFLRRGVDGETYLRTALSGSHRRQRHRLEKRLAELGCLEYAEPAPTADIQPWIETFLALEQQSWKGRSGTALACSESQHGFFRAIVGEAFRRNQLLMQSLQLNGTSIAQRVSFVAAPGAFAFKTAFDEHFAYYAPGALLEVATIRLLHARPDLEWMDSCTASDNALMNRLWKDTRSLHTWLIGSGKGLGKWVLRMRPLWHQLSRRAPFVFRQ